MVIAFTAQFAVSFVISVYRRTAKKFGRKAPIRVNLPVALEDHYSLLLGQDQRQ